MPGGLPRDSWPRFNSNWAADSSEDEQEADDAVVVHDAAGGGTGSIAGADQIIVLTPPTSPIITLGGGLGVAGADLWAGGFMLSPERKIFNSLAC